MEKLAKLPGDHSYAQLAKFADMFVKSEPQTQKFMNAKFRALEKSDQASSNIITVPNCRHPAIACLKSTQVSRAFHMNKMLDYYGYTILIAMAPRVNEFEQFWETILQHYV